VPICFREKAYQDTLKKKLKLGYLAYKNGSGEYELGVESLPISKGTKRAIQTTINKLKADGHTLVPFEVTLEEMD